MFDLVDRPRVWITVRFAALAPGDGPDEIAKPVEHEIDVHVELLGNDKYYEFYGYNEAGKQVEGAAKPASELLIYVGDNWRGLLDAGKAVPFTADNVKRLCEKAPTFPAAFGFWYEQAIAGRVATREKNSDGSPESGRAEQASGETETAQS